ncbi:high-affinity nicotinic acid transporter [Trichomonascus vanleenenianus]|uniref:high-affinity nicotinic acid transporter n=1 Tax=Trichomonascus vanleenenianus TaxID=2268995 RepID=UPI003ECA6FBC
MSVNKSPDFKDDVVEEARSISSTEGGQIRGLNIDIDALNLSKTQPEFSFFGIRKTANFDKDAIATQPSVFDDPSKAQLYWPKHDYENVHRLDPEARWTWKEEFKIVRKIDFRIMLWVALMFFCLELDRSNLSQALSDNFLDDLNLNTNDYNNGNTIFKLAFLVAELPSQLISKRVGPDRWIPSQICLWSIVAIFQFFLSGRASFYITRALLGLLQGGFIPDVILYLSYFYTGKELPVRCSWFWSSMYLADIASAFLGFGILHMGGVHGKAGWRWLFLIEGAFTLGVGLLSFGMMPAAPTATAGWLRGKKGWFTEREEVVMTNRVLRDDPTKGDMNNRQGITPRILWNCIKDYGLWPIYLLGLLFSLPVAPVSNYLTLTLRSLGFGTFETNLLVIPSSVLTLLMLLLFTYLSEVINSRTLLAACSQFWVFPCLVALNTFGATTNKWAKYAVTTILIGYPYPHAIQVAWTSRNSNTVGARTVSASLYNISVQISSIISAQIYRNDDKPLYKRGNHVLLALNCVAMLAYGFTWLYYRELNRRKEKVWKNMTADEQDEYLATTTDSGSRRLDFRYAY